MFEDHKAKKAAEAHEKAVADWQAQRDDYANLLDVAQNYPGTTADSILLGAGEAVFLSVNDASLIEDRRGPGHYAGHSQGVSIPIARVAGRPIRYRVGVNKGHYVQGTPTPAAVDTGTMFITNTRVIFQGSKQTRECAFTKLIGFESNHTDGFTSFSISNRQKTITIHYGPSLADEVDFRLNLALAHFRGDVGPLVKQLQDKLAELDAHRPPDLDVPPIAPAPTAVPTSDALLRAPSRMSSSTDLPAVDPSSPPSGAPADPAPLGPSGDVAAGWYADPWGVTRLRWWDGTAWTGYVNDGAR